MSFRCDALSGIEPPLKITAEITAVDTTRIEAVKMGHKPSGHPSHTERPYSPRRWAMVMGVAAAAAGGWLWGEGPGTAHRGNQQAHGASPSDKADLKAERKANRFKADALDRRGEGFVSLERLTPLLSLTPAQVTQLTPLEKRAQLGYEKLKAQAKLELEDIRSQMTKMKADMSPKKGDPASPIGRVAQGQIAQLRAREALVAAVIQELEEEWLDVVEGVLSPTQLARMRSWRSPPEQRPATAIGPVADSPVERLARDLESLTLSAEQQNRLVAPLDQLRQRHAEALRAALAEVENLLTPDQRAASDKLYKARQGNLPADYLLSNFDSFKPEAAQRSQVAVIKANYQAALRRAFGDCQLDLRETLSPEQMTRLEKIRPAQDAWLLAPAKIAELPKVRKKD